MKKPSKIITRIMFKGQSFPIEASDGKRIISLGNNIAWFSSNFKEFGLDKPSQPTEKINVVIHEMSAGGTLFEAFSGINQDLSKLVLTMSNILEFCEQHPDKLRQDWFGARFLTEKRLSIFQKICRKIGRFLFNKKIGYFVVCVYVDSDGLYVYVFRLELGDVLDGECRHRLVSPQLTPSEA